MRYFYIFILTLILISCSEDGYAIFQVPYGEEYGVVDGNECYNALEKGKILVTTVDGKISGDDYTVWYKILYEGHIYKISMVDSFHLYFSKRKFRRNE